MRMTMLVMVGAKAKADGDEVEPEDNFDPGSEVLDLARAI